MRQARYFYGKPRANEPKQLIHEPLEQRCLLTVVISELMADNESTLADEDGSFSDWLELRNTGLHAVDLEGWYLTDNENNLTKWQLPSHTLGPFEHLVIFASEKDRDVGELHTNFKLSNNGEFLALVQGDGATVEFAYSPGFPPQSDDVSYGLSLDLSLQGYFANPTPGELNQIDPIPDGDRSVVINEIMYDIPRAGLIDPEKVQEEFIELHNRGNSVVNLQGWQISRGVDFTFSDVSIPAGDFLVLAADSEAFKAKYPEVNNVVGGWTGKLSNNGETIELVNETGSVIDSVRYSSEGDWSVRAVGPEDRGSFGWIWQAGHDGGGHSLELKNANMPNDVGQNWSASADAGGSPGRPNDATTTDSAPFISDVLHSPAIPQSNDPVTVSASLTDELSSATARLYWKVDTENDFQVVDMTTDGGGNFTATIPAQSDLTVIEFYVEASDAANHTRTWPAATSTGTQSANALYQVMDSFDQDATWNPDSVPIYFQIMTNAERREFTDINRQSDAQFNATFISVDGTGIDVHYNTGIRIRGSASRSERVPNNRIRFPDDRPWQGVTRININSVNPINQVAGAALFRLAGVETGNARGIRMFSNGIDLQNGVYAHVEVLGADYAQEHYPQDPDGNVYRGRRANESPPGGGGAGLRYLGPDVEPYVSYVKYSNSSEADWSDVMHLTEILRSPQSETYAQDVLAVADIDQWYRAINMNSLIANNEYGLFTGDPAGDDYAMYRGGVDQRFQMIPYDLDSLFGQTDRNLYRENGVPALQRIFNHPEFGYRSDAQYLDLINNVIRTDQTEEVLRNALRGFAGENQIQRILDRLEARAAYVEARIHQTLTVNSDLEFQSGFPRSRSPEIALAGRGPAATTQSVTVNGVLVDSLTANRSWDFSVAGKRDIETEIILPRGSEWRYMDDGSDQGTVWRQTEFNDGSWKKGNAELGYGEGDEATPISNGGEENNAAATSYFRGSFHIDDPDATNTINFALKYDDAAAIYLNGTEVFRSENLPADAAFDIYATAFRGNPEEQQFVSISISSDFLSVGENTLAVEIHQASAGSSDVSFDLEISRDIVTVEELDPNAAVHIQPGIKRYQIVAFDQAHGGGNIVGESHIDIWYDDGSIQNVTNDITQDTTWTAINGPYFVDSNITIADGATLTIEPGTTVFFGNDARLTIQGQITAIGKPFQEIRFTRLPGTNDWNGLQFRNSAADNRIEHAILEYGVAGNGMIGLEGSSLSLDHVVLDHTDRRRIRSINSSLVVRNSTFTNIFDPGVAPTTDNQSEHIWGRGVPTNGQWILENNFFGHITGHNDSIDFDASRLPNPIPIIRNNIFAGGGDDALDMTGDVWIEGNLFQNFIKDEFNNDPGESNTISSSSGNFWVVRNVFHNVQHASLVKEDAFMHFINNTVVNSSFAPLYFDLPGETDGPGRGAYVENSIFSNVPGTFDQIQDETDLTVVHSFLTSEDLEFVGNDNQFGDPHVGGAEHDFQLLPGSYAANSGTNGQDLGARIPTGAFLIGVPHDVTSLSNATILVNGPAITEYRFRLDGNALSSAIPINTPIQLNGLTEGPHTLEVIGKNEIGVWQSESEATMAQWTVDHQYVAPIQISEILAGNRSIDFDGSQPDLIELYNPNPFAVNISGYTISDDAANPAKHLLPVGTTIGAEQYLVFAADNQSTNNHLSFALNDLGDELYLYDTVNELVDSVEFGSQIDDQSISRIHEEWVLSLPTFGQSNIAQPVVDSANVTINEWYTSGRIRIEQDFVELYNASQLPADLSGHHLSDYPHQIPSLTQLRPLSFIPADGFTEFIADGRPQRGLDHLAFRLSPDLEFIGLLDAEQQILDIVYSVSQTSEVSMGRVPNGSTTIESISIPTPNATNGSSNTISYGFDWNEDWKYEASGTDLGTEWREVDFDDGDWPMGAGPLGQENEALQVPLVTGFEIGAPTYYFRREFTLPEEIGLNQMTATISTTVDDGFVVYLNGQEALRRGMPDGEILFDTLANRNVNEAQIEGPFDISSDLLVAGTNVFAVEVHQTRIGSSDLVFGLQFDATSVVSDGNDRTLMDQALRISEIMYNSPDGPGHDFVEITNILDQPISLQGVRLGDGIDFEFSAITLQPHEFVVVAEDVDLFLQRYGSGHQLVGQFSGQLSDNGEKIALQFPHPFDAAIERIDYDDAWYPSTDGKGRSLEIVTGDRRFDQWSVPEAWKASTIIGGTPGYDSGEPPVSMDIVINEILSHTDPPLVDAIELYNAGESEVDIGGWFLTDSAKTITKFQVPDGTVFNAGTYLVFDESDFNPTQGNQPEDFALSSAHGERLWLWSVNAHGDPAQIVETVSFAASANGETLGRIPNGTGPLYPQQRRSLGSENGEARVGPIILSEVNYHPTNPSAAALALEPAMDDDDLEYIEIFNPTNTTVDLTNWRLRRGADFEFPAALQLPSRQTALVVSFDVNDAANANRLQAFRTHYGISDQLVIVGGYRGKLNNGEDVIQLQRPDSPPVEEPTFIPHLIEDEISYDDNLPWPTSVDGNGDSLHRILPAKFGHDATSWKAAAPSPGSVSGAGLPGDLNDDGVVDELDINILCIGIRNQITSMDLTADNLVDEDDILFLVKSIMESTIGDANLDGAFTSRDFVAVFQIGEYEDGIPENSLWHEGDWNCDGDFTSGDLVFAFQIGDYSREAVGIANGQIAGVFDATESIEWDSGEGQIETIPPMEHLGNQQALVPGEVVDMIFAERPQPDGKLAEHDDLSNDQIHWISG